MSVAASTMVIPWAETSPIPLRRPKSLVLLKARWRENAPSPSEGWNEPQNSDWSEQGGGGTCSGDGWGTGHFSSALEPSRTETLRKQKIGSECWRPGRSKALGGMERQRKMPRQEDCLSHAALAVGPMRVTSVLVRPLEHGELYRRPPGRASTLKPLGTAARSHCSAPPVEPAAFDPRVIDTGSLCVGNGISRGAAVTSQATALRHKQLQFRHQMHKTTHKSAGLVRLISITKEKDGRAGSSTASSGGDLRRHNRAPS